MRTGTLLAGIILSACGSAEDKALEQLISEQTARLEKERTVLPAEKIAEIKQKCGGQSYIWQQTPPGGHTLFIYNADEGSFVVETTYPAGVARPLPEPTKDRVVDSDGDGLINERILFHVNPRSGQEVTIETMVYFDPVKYEEYVQKMVDDTKEDIKKGEKLDLRERMEAIATGYAGVMLDEQEAYVAMLATTSYLPPLDSPSARSSSFKITCPAEIQDKYRTKARRTHQEEKTRPIRPIPLPVYPTELEHYAPKPQLVVDVAQLCDGRPFELPLSNLGGEYTRDEATLSYDGKGFMLTRVYVVDHGIDQTASQIGRGDVYRGKYFQETIVDAEDPLGIPEKGTELRKPVMASTNRFLDEEMLGHIMGTTTDVDMMGELRKPEPTSDAGFIAPMLQEGYKTALERAHREGKKNVTCNYSSYKRTF